MVITAKETSLAETEAGATWSLRGTGCWATSQGASQVQRKHLKNFYLRQLLFCHYALVQFSVRYSKILILGKCGHIWQFWTFWTIMGNSGHSGQFWIFWAILTELPRNAQNVKNCQYLPIFAHNCQELTRMPRFAS